jgi:hypothetical protein
VSCKEATEEYTFGSRLEKQIKTIFYLLLPGYVYSYTAKKEAINSSETSAVFRITPELIEVRS